MKRFCFRLISDLTRCSLILYLMFQLGSGVGGAIAIAGRKYCGCHVLDVLVTKIEMQFISDAKWVRKEASSTGGCSIAVKRSMPSN